MKTKWKSGFLAGIALLITTGVWADQIQLRADIWCPYNCEPGNDHPGFIIEIAKEIFQAAGHQVDYQLMPWARAVQEAKAGSYHGVVGAAQGDAEGFVFPANEQGLSGSAFYVKKGNPWIFHGVASLAKIRLGVINDYSYGTEIDEYIKTNRKDLMKVQEVSGDKALASNIKKLQLQRVDTILENQMVFRYFLQKAQIPDEFVEAGVLAADPIYIAFSPAHPKSKEYAELLSQGMEHLRQSGRLSQILKHYGLSDWRGMVAVQP